MIMEEMTMTEFEQGLGKTRTVIIPVGTVEEHGPHLPLSTDTIQAVDLAKRVSQRVDVFVAPPLHYGSCRSTRCHPGTIGVSAGSVRAMIRDIVKSLHLHGLRCFVILSGHAGQIHMGALNEVGEELLEEIPEIKIAILSGMDLFSNEGGVVETEGDSHAGEMETSMMLHLRPELVKGSAPEEYPQFPRPILVRDKRKYWPGGVWGDPSKASREKGERVMNLAVDNVVDLIKKLEVHAEG
jgi:creatinine amidohydrolase